MKQSPIFVRTYDLLRWLIPATVKFPRSQRFVLARMVQWTARNNDHPANFNDNNGLRVVVSDRFPKRASSAVHQARDGRPVPA